MQESLKIPIPLSGADELCHQKTFRADSRVISMTPRLRGKEERRREGSMEGGKKSESTAKLAKFFFLGERSEQACVHPLYRGETNTVL